MSKEKDLNEKLFEYIARSISPGRKSLSLNESIDRFLMEKDDDEPVEDDGQQTD